MTRIACRSARLVPALLALIAAPAVAQNPDVNPNLPKAFGKLDGPEPIPEVKLGENLATHPTARSAPGPSWTAVDAAPMPLDRQGIWVLEFSFKPVRMIEVDIPGKGRRSVHYMYYKVVNRTGSPRMFVPQFTLVTDTGQKIHDVVLPQAVKNIQAREDPTKDLLGAVGTTGMIPASTKDGVDDAVYGVAIWDKLDLKADAFKIFLEGLSDGYYEVKPPEGGEPFTRYKAARLDFSRPGDELRAHEREIRPMDPPYEWVYYP